MRKYLLTTAAAAALMLGACSKQATNNAEATAGNAADATGNALASAGDTVGNAAGSAGSAIEQAAGSVAGLAGAAFTNKAADFVPAAAQSDMYEIESSKLALAKSKSADIKKFAQEMITAHTGTTAKLKATLTSAKLTMAPPAAMDERHQGMIDTLKSAGDADFDKTYLDQQTAGHKEAVTLFKSYADDGDNADLKKLAGDTVPAIQKHLDMVQALDNGGADGTK